MLQNEDMQLREQIDRYNMRMREFNEKQRQYRGQQERTPDQDLEVSSLTWETKDHLILKLRWPKFFIESIQITLVGLSLISLLSLFGSLNNKTNI